jgi:hypothetical protein
MQNYMCMCIKVSLKKIFYFAPYKSEFLVIQFSDNVERKQKLFILSSKGFMFTIIYLDHLLNTK